MAFPFVVGAGSRAIDLIRAGRGARLQCKASYNHLSQAPTMRAKQAILVTLALLLLACPAAAHDRLGIVMLHGKQGVPEQLQSYDAPLAALGHLTDRPELCWSRRRIYDRTYPDCLREVDAAIDRLKTRGATAFVVIGMSLGGNAVLAYGARHPGLKGIVALAPAHAVELLARRPDIAGSIKRARTMIAAGHGDEKTTFAEVNTGESFTVTTTPNIYLSFHGADSIAAMPSNAAKLTAPLLYVAGVQDSTQRGRGYVFDKASKNPLNRYVTVPADHRGTPAAGLQAVMEWIGEIGGSRITPAGSAPLPPR
jgi:pimeloyl-ACP methyl ester carboxylesterase